MKNKIIQTMMYMVLATSLPCIVNAAVAVEGCKESSISPSVYSFFGTKDIIMQKITDQNFILPSRRIFVQITRGENSAEVKIFERKENGNYDVSKWTGPSIGDLYSKLNAVIFSNKGVNCVGEQVKAALNESLTTLEVHKDIPAPESGLAAFAHSVKDTNGDFIETDIYILC